MQQKTREQRTAKIMEKTKEEVIMLKNLKITSDL